MGNQPHLGFPPLTTLELPMVYLAYGDTIILLPPYRAEESFEMRDTSLRLVLMPQLTNAQNSGNLYLWNFLARDS